MVNGLVFSMIMFQWILSGGQRQIVNMIGGLINPSKILVLDEPTNALDPELKKEVLGLIKDFSRYKQAVFRSRFSRCLG